MAFPAQLPRSPARSECQRTWYRELIGADPVPRRAHRRRIPASGLGIRNGTLFGIHQHDREFEGGSSRVPGRADHTVSAAPVAPSWRWYGGPAQ
jgi:hypothetical protein